MSLLATAHGFGLGVEKLGVVVVALLAAVAVLGRPPLIPEAPRAAAMLGVLVLTPVLLVADIWDTSQLRHLRGHPAEAGVAIVLGVAVVVALAVAFVRHPPWLAIAAVAAVPFRLPISTGGTQSNLLIPLYLVVGAGALAFAAQSLRGRRSSTAEPPSPVGWLERLLMASVVLYALQAAYSGDFSKALENVVFFYVPFALLFAFLVRVQWSRQLLLICLGIAAGEAMLFSGIGFVEYARKKLLLNPKVVAANQYSDYFRVNSLFFDPNVYGRFLALVMVAVTVVVMWTRERRVVGGCALVLAWLMGGLVTSFSQSSMAALLLGLAVIAAWRFSVRDTLLVCAGLVCVALLVVVLAPSSSHLGINGSKSADNATSGRYSLVSNGLHLFTQRPLQGYGSGSFARQYQREYGVPGEETQAASASHTIPVTVAAEQGIVGLALYVALLVAAFGRLFAGAGRSPERIAVAACFAALVLHTMTYADFLEDPITWTLLGIGSALALRDARRPVSAAAPPPADALAPAADLQIA